MKVLAIGSRGADVLKLQQELNKIQGINLVEDGVFGRNTRTAVINFQQKNALTADGIVGAKTLQALGILPHLFPKYLILHCSATPENSPHWNAARIKNFHVNDLKWGRCGYSSVIEYDGKIVETHPVDLTDGFQPFQEMTYGTGVTEFDWNAVNICYVGGVDATMQPKDTRTDAQKEALKKYIFEFIDKNKDIQILGHNQVFPKACPSFSVPEFLKEIGVKPKNIYKSDPWGIAKSYENKI